MLGGVLNLVLILACFFFDIILGMPLQSTTDAGLEMTLMFALANALQYVN